MIQNYDSNVVEKFVKPEVLKEVVKNQKEQKCFCGKEADLKLLKTGVFMCVECYDNFRNCLCGRGE